MPETRILSNDEKKEIKENRLTPTKWGHSNEIENQKKKLNNWDNNDNNHKNISKIVAKEVKTQYQDEEKMNDDDDEPDEHYYDLSVILNVVYKPKS